MQNKAVEYALRKTRRSKVVRLVVDRDGSVVVCAPLFVSTNTIENFIRAKAHWLLSKISLAASLPPRPSMQARRSAYLQHKAEAERIILQTIETVNQHYQFTYRRVSVRNQRSRWGSCSKQGNLSFNYKLLFLPEHLRTYVVVHELCHLKEFNHSPRFWSLVAQTISQPRRTKRELSQIGILAS